MLPSKDLLRIASLAESTIAARCARVPATSSPRSRCCDFVMLLPSEHDRVSDPATEPVGIDRPKLVYPDSRDGPRHQDSSGLPRARHDLDRKTRVRALAR